MRMPNLAFLTPCFKKDKTLYFTTCLKTANYRTLKILLVELASDTNLKCNVDTKLAEKINIEKHVQKFSLNSTLNNCRLPKTTKSLICTIGNKIYSIYSPFGNSNSLTSAELYSKENFGTRTLKTYLGTSRSIVITLL